MRNESIPAARRSEVYERDAYTCQYCGAEGGPDQAADLAAERIVPEEVGGNDRTINLLTVCHDCYDAGSGSGPVNVYLARFARLVREVRAGQRAASTYVDCCRGMLEGDAEAVERYGDVREAFVERCDEIEDAIDSVESLPKKVWPASEGLRTDHERCLSIWKGWERGSVALVKQVDQHVKRRRSGTTDCPACGGGVRPGDEFCRLCGVDLDGADVSPEATESEQLDRLIELLTDATGIPETDGD